MNVRKKEKGITLIALAVTIIVMLILAGVTMAALTSENGIINQANIVKETNKVAKTEEEARLEYSSLILEKQMEGHGEATELSDVIGKLEENGYETAEKEGKSYIKIGEYYYEIKLENEQVSIAKEKTEGITGGDGGSGTEASNSQSYVGYYADVDGDGTPEGIIFADLLHGKTGTWSTNNDSTYTIPTRSSTSIKKYTISEERYINALGGEKEMVIPTGSGEDRFYVMSLSDFNTGTYYDWYNAAYGKMSDYATYTSKDFGKGKENTQKMIEKWNASGYGKQDNCLNHKDMWGQIQTDVNNGWFVPSKDEWSAFGGELGITTSNYSSKGLKSPYWPSSQSNSDNAWRADIYYGYMNFDYVYGHGFVRLATTF